MKNRVWSILVFAVVLLFVTTVVWMPSNVGASGSSAVPTSTPEKLLTDEELSGLLDQLKEGLAELVGDEEKATAIAEKWDAREDLAGKTRKQVLGLLFNDVRSIVTDKGLQDSVWAAWNRAPEPEPSETPIAKPNPPTRPNANGTLGQYIRGLSYDPSNLLSVQTTGNQPILERVLKRDEDRQIGDGKVIICTRTTRNLSRNFEEIGILQPTRGVIYPGSLIFADKKLVDGSPRPLTGLPLAPLNLRLDLPGLPNGGSFTVAEPTEDKLQNGLNEALDVWNNSAGFRNGYVNQALSSHNSTVSYSSEQLPLSLGFKASWAQGSVSAQFKNTSDSEKNVVAVVFKQIFYTVKVDSPRTPEGFFDSSVTAEQAQAIFSSDDVPAYISSVNYGRIIMLRMETDKTIRAIDAEAALQYAAGLINTTGDTKTKYDSILSNSAITVVTVGANAGVETSSVSAGALKPIIKGGNAVYSKSNLGLPISYTVKFLKDNAVAKVGTTAVYNEIDCQDARNKWIEIRQTGWYVADYTVTWDEPGRPAQKVEGKYTVGNTMHVSFPGDATNIRINLRTISDWPIVNKVLQPSELNKAYSTGGHATGPTFEVIQN